jgi:hypothetical protein
MRNEKGKNISKEFPIQKHHSLEGEEHSALCQDLGHISLSLLYYRNRVKMLNKRRLKKERKFQC